MLSKIALLLPEQVVSEVEAVIERKFSGDPNKTLALSFFELLRHSSQIVAYAECKPFLNVASKTIRDRKDVVILAAVMASKPDFFVTGDADFLSLCDKVQVKIVSAKDFFKSV